MERSGGDSPGSSAIRTRALVAGIYGESMMVLRDGDDALVRSVPSAHLDLDGDLAVGDRVTVVPGATREVSGDVEPRHTRLVRVRGDRTRLSAHSMEEAVLAANADIAIIVASVASHPFHPRLVDR